MIWFTPKNAAKVTATSDSSASTRRALLRVVKTKSPPMKAQRLTTKTLRNQSGFQVYSPAKPA